MRAVSLPTGSERRMLSDLMDLVRLAAVATIPVAVVLGHPTFGQLWP